jgi:endonuclease/exonuclease/phosphatase family metal-dependent hydrolase
VTVVNTHLSFVPGWNRAQLSRLRRDLAAFPGPLVLMGDLNMVPPRPAAITGYRTLAAEHTFPVQTPDRQLDHVLLRGDFGRVRAAESRAMPLSDHRALIVDLDPA